MAPSSSEDLYPIAILIDELKSEDVQLRLNAIHRISTIALALGPQRARDELVPFIQESLDDEDEVLLALAEELGKNFEDHLGGPQHAHLLLAPLENLAAVEETLVRDKVRSLATAVHGRRSPFSLVLQSGHRFHHKDYGRVVGATDRGVCRSTRPASIHRRLVHFSHIFCITPRACL